MARLLIVGGCGFVGSNLADRLLDEGNEIVLFDNLSADEAQLNLDWLIENHGRRIRFVQGDIRHLPSVESVARRGYEAVVHAAGKMACSNSRESFEINAAGTLNVLEAIRQSNHPSSRLLFMSSGGLPSLASCETPQQIMPHAACEHDRPKPDAASVYRRSMAAAEQYVSSYARSFDLPAVVFRLWTPFGVRQLGGGEQSWISRCVVSAEAGHESIDCNVPNTKQDVLYIEDLVEAACLALRNCDTEPSRTYNIGGGASRAILPTELRGHLERLSGRQLGLQLPKEIATSDVANIRRAENLLGWRPRTPTLVGVAKYFNWLRYADHPVVRHVEIKRAA